MEKTNDYGKKCGNAGFGQDKSDTSIIQEGSCQKGNSLRGALTLTKRERLGRDEK